MRKIWYTLSILIISGGIIFLGYYFRPKSKSNLTYLDNTPSPSASSSQGGVIPQELKPIFQESVLAYRVYQGGALAVDLSGKIVQTDGKNEVILSSSSVPSIFSASISYDRNFVLIGLGEINSPQFRIWNAQKNTWRFLPSGTFSASLSPATHQLAYLEKAATGVRLSVLNLDSALSKGTAAATLPLEDVYINWVSTDKIELKEKGALLAPSSEFIFNLPRKTASVVVKEKNGLDILWAPSAKTALVLLGQARGGNMFLVDTAGQVLQTLSFLTIPEKCAWSGDQILFCALPQNRDALKTQLPDSFYKKSFFTDDNFYKINTVNGDVEPVLENKNNLDAESLAIFGDSLYFINRLDEKLYSLPIPK